MQISVFGCGYVGLVTGACFAEMGNDVTCVDVDGERIAALRGGACPIFEPGLHDLLRRNVAEGRLRFEDDGGRAVRRAEIVFVAVGTPAAADGSAELSQVRAAARCIGAHMDGYRAVVIKSTVPVGAADQVRATVAAALRQRDCLHPFDVVANPEFLREGCAIGDCLRPSRVVVGCETPRARALMEALYKPFLKSGNPLLAMDTASAEMTKYAANAMLAARVSLMNELSRLCERVGADIEQVRQGVGSDARIGRHFLYAGLGFGGSCFPKDLRALIRVGEAHDENLAILRAVEQANVQQQARFFGRVRAHFAAAAPAAAAAADPDPPLRGRRIAVWGLAFKPGTDDVRCAPALDIIARLLRAGAEVVAFDPVASARGRAALGAAPRLHFAVDQYAALADADALCVLTEWPQFREPDFRRMRRAMRQRVIFDGRNLYDAGLLEDRLGPCCYYPIGQPPHRSAAPAADPA